MKPATKIFVYDQFLERCISVAALLGMYQDFEFVGNAINFNTVTTDLKKNKPHIVLLDIDMPNSLEIIKAISKINNEIKVVIQTDCIEQQVIINCLRNGVQGYLVKSDSPTKFLSSLADVASGGVALSTIVAKHVVNYFSPSVEAKFLTKKELQVLTLLSQGNSYKMVANLLNVEYTTVNTHAKRLYNKLNVTRLSEAIAFYYTYVNK